LGLASATDIGGGGEGLRAAADVVNQVARHCSSTAMVLMMHYAATAALEAHGPTEARREIAVGRHLTTLAFSEAGSRSHFWAPMSTAVSDDDGIRLDARKSWVTAAGEADSYVWSSRPVDAEGLMSLWLVPSSTPGLTVSGPFDGLGLRGNASRPITAEGVKVASGSMLGEDGTGLDVALAVILPWFLVMNAAASVGLMEAVTNEAASHLASTRLEHLDQSLAQQPGLRAELARMRLETDKAAALLNDTIQAIETGREDATLRVLGIKAATADTAVHVADQAMKVCGGAAFRKELGVERRLRDALAARVMAPTTDALLDFVGRVLTGLPLMEGAG
ncbi:MAG: acyl-CoA dehydrogenase, partial [Actinobacteria bacterium]|nr:acyl-CoA dehydrogenase [Actinomycetota bacterium]